jgi:AcrR family transcriptional regulator
MPERADAARNRVAILRAADRLLAERGTEQVSVEDVARAAGVGKGTVFHRFGSRAGLLRALVFQRIEDLDNAMATGPPPLGPGVPATERLTAFLDALVELATRNIGLLAAYERAEGDRQGNVVYQSWHHHVSELITECRPDLDAELVAHILLSSLHTDLVVHLLRRGETERLTATLHQLVETLFASK